MNKVAMPETLNFNEEKFKQVLHYIIHRCGHLENVGKTVLFKMLYFSDFNYYELQEKSITGETYVKLPLGPGPTHFDKIIEALKKEGKIKEERIKTPSGRIQFKFLCLVQPEKSLMTVDEKDVIDKNIEILSKFTATQISAYSHGDIPYRATKDGEDIDYELVFYRDPIFSVREYPNDSLQSR